MKFLVYYITDAERKILTKEEVGEVTFSDCIAQLNSESPTKRKADLRVIKLETEVKLRGRDMWEFDDGKCVKHFVAFDTTTAPPTIIMEKLDLGQLRWLDAPLPMSWLNRHGSIINSEGEIVMRGENEPPAVEAYGQYGFAGTTGSTSPIMQWPPVGTSASNPYMTIANAQNTAAQSLYATSVATAPVFIPGVSGHTSLLGSIKAGLGFRP